MIQAIIFDLGGVLIDLDMKGCFENIKALGVDIDALSRYANNDDEEGRGATICEGITASGIMNQYQIGKVSTEQFLGAIMDLTTPRASYEEVLEAWNSCLLTIPQYKLDFIKELRREGYATYLLSNTNDAHWRFIEDNSFPEPISNYFDKTFLSQEMKMAKPNDEIYRAVLNEIATPADECLFIDDSKANCQAAESIGIRSLNVDERTDYRQEVRQIIGQQR